MYDIKNSFTENATFLEINVAENIQAKRILCKTVSEQLSIMVRNLRIRIKMANILGIGTNHFISVISI